jgi:hypothetical protein
MSNIIMKDQQNKIRIAVADYIRSEGCGCCSDRDGHKEAGDRLGKLLKIPKYKDGSGYDFSKFETEK